MKVEEGDIILVKKLDRLGRDTADMIHSMPRVWLSGLLTMESVLMEKWVKWWLLFCPQ